jgi:hypothetical protein
VALLLHLGLGTPLVQTPQVSFPSDRLQQLLQPLLWWAWRGRALGRLWHVVRLPPHHCHGQLQQPWCIPSGAAAAPGLATGLAAAA